jgi:hypothetical protein
MKHKVGDQVTVDFPRVEMVNDMMVKHQDVLSIKDGDVVYSSIFRSEKFEIVKANEKDGYMLKVKGITLPFYIPETFLVE